MRVALYGGSFDPPHRGHVALARLAADRLHLDRVFIAPVGLQPLKQDAAAASFEDRIAMARIAFAGDSRMEVSRLDAPHADGRPNYTIDTVLQLKRTLSGDEIFCLIGADAWLTIKKWHRAPDLLMSCDFIVGARPGFNLAHIAAALPPGISAAHSLLDVLNLRGPAGKRSRLYLLPDLAEDVSATEVRAALSSGHAGEEQAVLDPGVAKYIRAHKLYAVDVRINPFL